MFGVRKLEWLIGRQAGEGRMIIDSVVWKQYINVTDTQTATQPRRHSNSPPNALRRAAKMVEQI